MADLPIRNVCVIGAGTMGGGIAAHLANLGLQVTLLDANQQSATTGLDRARTARPPLFYVPERAGEIRVGNIQDHLQWVSEAEWVCEAIVERMDLKRALLAQLDAVVRPDALLTTNTSGLEISLLAEGLSDSFRQRFVGAHFFNPPRYLKLLEVIPTPDTSSQYLRAVVDFFETSVARRVVVAKDTPGFIANRFGMWSMFHATRVAERLQFAVEDVDAITGAFLGRPKSGTFRLNDIVGLDVMRDIAQNLLDRKPDDPQIRTLEQPSSVFALLARGWLGDKTGHGYYRREGRELLALDLKTLAYRMAREPDLPALAALGALPLGERIGRALDQRDEVGEFLREYLIPTLRYADSIKEEVSASVLDFDRVMMWGFGWEVGPFAMIDAIGHERLGITPSDPFYKGNAQLAFSGGYRTIKEEPENRKISEYQEVGRGANHVLRDLGDGVLAVSITTKMGVISPVLIAELAELLSHKIDRFVLTSESKSFSAGFDLNFFSSALETGDLGSIDKALQGLQALGELLEGRPCVAAVFGHCLGAGLELALSCAAVVADAETKIGLPESKVGLLPGGRGVTLMRLNNSNSTKRLCEITMTLADGTISANTDMARQLGYLRPTDVTVYNADRLMFEAKKLALTVTPVPRNPWTPAIGPLVGMIDQSVAEQRAAGNFTEHDVLIAGKIRQIVARATGYEDALAKERSEFLDLSERAMTQARIRHMLGTNRPLRN